MYDLVNIKTKEDVETFQKYIDQFQTIYESSFPSNEREPYDNIIDRIKNSSRPITAMKLVLECEDDLPQYFTKDKHAVKIPHKEVIGGVITDYYPECNAIEVIYIAITRRKRGLGIGKKLMAQVDYEYPNIEHTFFETDDPTKISGGAMDPVQRLAMWMKWGYDVLHINYVQPPLSPDKDGERNLLLLHKGNELTKESLKSFLTYFYKYLGYENSVELQNMLKEIDETTAVK